jgi:hypothetical protein
MSTIFGIAIGNLFLLFAVYLPFYHGLPSHVLTFTRSHKKAQAIAKVQVKGGLIAGISGRAANPAHLFYNRILHSYKWVLEIMHPERFPRIRTDGRSFYGEAYLGA